MPVGCPFRPARRGTARQPAPGNFASMPLIDSAIELRDASGPVRKATGLLRRGLVELGAGRIALLAQPRDEHLRQRDPLAGLGLPARRGSRRARPRWSPCPGRAARTRTSTRPARARANRSVPAAPSCRRDRPARARPASFRMSAFVPVATMRPSRIAMASTMWNCGSTVTILPLWKTWLGGWLALPASRDDERKKELDEVTD